MSALINVKESRYFTHLSPNLVLKKSFLPLAYAATRWGQSDAAKRGRAPQRTSRMATQLIEEFPVDSQEMFCVVNFFFNKGHQT